MPEYYFDESSSEYPIKWIEKFCSTTDGRPFQLLDYQKDDIIRPMFGWKVAETGDFKHRISYIEIPKGNGKSGLMSALAAYLAFAAGVENAEIYCIANDRKQAGIIHEDIKKLVKANAKLDSISKVYRDSIYYEKTGSIIKAVSSDVASSHGWRPSGLVFDETHEMKKKDLFDSYIAGLMKRRNSMAFILTTAGKLDTVGWEIHKMAEDAKADPDKYPHWLVNIYKADEKLPPLEEATFASCNPAYPVLLRKADYEVMASMAKSNPSNLASFKRLHLNIWTGKMEDWVTAAEWDKCSKYEECDLSTIPCYGGLDLASTRDLNAFALVWRLPSGTIKARLWFWVPQGTVQTRIETENLQYQGWIDDGRVWVTPGNAADHTQIYEQIIDTIQVNNYDVHQINFDRWGAVGAVEKLVSQSGIRMNPIGQGYQSLSVPTKTLEAAIIDGNFDHEGNPVLSWMVNNCKVMRDERDNVKLVKASDTGKIDGVAALVNAIAALIDHEAPEQQMPDDWRPTFL